MTPPRPGAFNPLVHQVAPPPIPTAQAWLGDYDGAHGPALDLSQAVPGYPPHPDLLAWLADAAGSREAAHYGAITGDAAFRSAYAEHVGAVYGARFSPDQVQITAGCNQAFFVAAMALAGPGAAVALTNPYYFNHHDTLRMLGIGTRTVTCRADNGFVPSPQDIAAVLDTSVRVLALVTPNNPTGAVYDADTLARIFALCRSKGVWLVLDETYRDFHHFASHRPHGLFDHPDWPLGLVQLYSFSKSFCIPGHRVGAIVAGSKAIEQIAKIMDNLQICAPRPAQIALARALPELADWRSANRAEIADRGAAFERALAEAEDWEVAAMGAYFAYVRHPFPGRPAVAVAERLARRFGVLTLPGGFFGTDQDRFLRLAFANVDQAMIAALPERLNRASASGGD